MFSVIAFYGLLLLVNVEIFHFMPSSSGPEGGLIDASIGLIFGGVAALAALLFAFLHFRRARNARFSRLLLQWCGAVTVGFFLVIIYMIADYSHAHMS
jgi:uncharacterized membrane protein